MTVDARAVVVDKVHARFYCSPVDLPDTDNWLDTNGIPRVLSGVLRRKMVGEMIRNEEIITVKCGKVVQGRKVGQSHDISIASALHAAAT